MDLTLQNYKVGMCREMKNMSSFLPSGTSVSFEIGENKLSPGNEGTSEGTMITFFLEAYRSHLFCPLLTVGNKSAPPLSMSCGLVR